jgi:undecaprenyl pyrophosphate phosphatase UppP
MTGRVGPLTRAPTGLSWRWAFALVAAMLAVLAVVFTFTVRLWQIPQRPRASEQSRTRSKVRLAAAVCPKMIMSCALGSV